MEMYYGVMLLFASLLQETREGFNTSFQLSLLTLLNSKMFIALQSLGIPFFQAVIFIDLLYLIPCWYYRNTMIGQWCGVVVCLSLVTNLFYLTMPLDLYDTFKVYYKNMSVILFELLMWGCFKESAVMSFINFTFIKPFREMCDLYDKAVDEQREESRK